jgi:hypothetical protein
MTTDLSTPNEAAPPNPPKPSRLPRDGVVVTGSLFSGGTLGWFLSLFAEHLPAPWKETMTKLIPLATSAISGLVYLASRMLKSYLDPRRFEADRQAIIRACDARLQTCLRMKVEIPKSACTASIKNEMLKQVTQEIDITERRKMLAELAEYPERRWEQVRETVVIAKRKTEAAE